MRLLGVGVGNLNDTGTVQGMLFDREDRQKQTRLDTVVDELKERFGSTALEVLAVPEVVIVDGSGRPLPRTVVGREVRRLVARCTPARFRR